MPRHKRQRRKPAEVEKDRKAIEELYREGVSQAAIARQLKISPATVSRDLKTIIKRWMEQTVHNLDEHKAKQLKLLDKLEREYWEAWERSKELTPIKLKDRDGVERTLYRPASHYSPMGVVGYIEKIHKVIDQRIKILGLEAPKKVDMNVQGDVGVKGYVSFDPSDWDEDDPAKGD